MRICVVYDCLYPYTVGGAERWYRALAERLAAQRRFIEATRAALAAVKADALRESPHATLMRVHLAEGNRSEAIRELTRYEKLLSFELGIAPSPALRALVDTIERAHIAVTPR